jgi:hypothetical protein
MWITDKKQPYLFGIMLKPQHNVIADNVLGLAATMMDYTNPYADLPEMKYSGLKPNRKSPMTNKQKKARAASKRAKQARKRGR